MREIEGQVPDALKAWWQPNMYCLHSPAWWQRHWERTGILDMERADSMPEGWEFWLQWHRLIAPDNHVEIQALEGKRLSNPSIQSPRLVVNWNHARTSNRPSAPPSQPR